jgi:glyoxylase-like metal-dependent hydrolase (beta-lactamase superfamily II)
MEITSNIHHISLGYVNAYLIVEPEGLTLIDTGTGSGHKAILAYIEEIGCQLTDLKHILITHGDPDHTGSLKKLVEASGAKAYASQIEAEAWAQGKGSRRLNFGLFTTPVNAFLELFSRPNKPMDEILEPGQILPMLGGLEVIATPGHTPGHISFFARREGVLFAGDSMRSKPDQLIPGNMRMVTWDEEKLIGSIRLQKELAPQIVCVGHGPVVFEAKNKFPSMN